jgi:hypothetical protein
MQHDLQMALSKELLGTCSIEKLNMNSTPLKLAASRRNFSSIIESFIRFCRDFGCDANNISSSLKKAIIASIRSVQLKDAIESIDDVNTFIDLDLLLQNNECNRFGDDMEWIKLTQLIHFDTNIDIMLNDIKQGLPSIYFVINLIQEMKLKETISLENMLKMYLLTNIKQLTSRHVLELFCSNLLHRDFSKEVLIFTSLLADQRFDQEQFTRDIIWLLKHMRFDDNFQLEYQHFMKQELSLQEVMKQRTMQNLTRGRVRLRERIPKTGSTKWQTQRICSAESQQALDSFNGWIARVRFPQITTRRMKLNAYFIRSQPTIDHALHIRKHYVEDVAAIILEHPISIPEISVIQNVIQSVRMNRQPFQELVEFRRECFGAFAQKDSRGLTWLQIVQLYIAAYQYKPIWAECWKSILPILSHQIIVDVEKFCSSRTYNGDEVVDIIIKS